MNGMPVVSIRQALSEMTHDDLLDYCLAQSVLTASLIELLNPEAMAAVLMSDSEDLLRGAELSKGVRDRVSELEREKVRMN